LQNRRQRFNDLLDGLKHEWATLSTHCGLSKDELAAYLRALDTAIEGLADAGSTMALAFQRLAEAKSFRQKSECCAGRQSSRGPENSEYPRTGLIPLARPISNRPALARKREVSLSGLAWA
jgi:hypothetical protein